MSAKGYIQVRAYTSNALIPLKDVAVAITDTTGAAIALRLTNRNGELDAPIEIVAPALSAGQTPNTGITPFTSVNLSAKIEDFEEIEALNVQIFPNTVTIQNLELIPLSELPEYWNQVEIFNTPSQNL